MADEALRSDLSGRVLQLLRRKMRERGHGTMARIQRQLGLGPTYFSDKRQTLDVGLVLQVLGELGLGPADFFGQVEQWEKAARSMPPVPAGAESVAEYYLQGRHREEIGDEPSP